MSVPPGISSEDFPTIQTANQEYLEKLNEVAKDLGDVAKVMSTRKFAKNTKDMTGMFKSMDKANIKIMVIQTFLSLLESITIVLEPFAVFLEILGAIIEVAVTPAVIELTKVFKPAYEGMIIWMKMVQGFGQAVDKATTAGERMNIFLGWFGTSLEEIGDWWVETGSIIMEGLSGQLVIVGDIMEYFTGLITSLGNSMSNIGQGSSKRGSGSSNPVQEFFENLIPGAAEGAIVSARAGGTRMTVAEGGEDEIIAPLSKLGADPEMLSYIRAGAEASMELLELKKRNRLRQKRIF